MGIPDDWTWPLIKGDPEGGALRSARHRRQTLLGNARSIHVCVFLLMSLLGQSGAQRPPACFSDDPTQPHEGFIARMGLPLPTPGDLPLLSKLPLLELHPEVHTIFEEARLNSAYHAYRASASLHTGCAIPPGWAELHANQAAIGLVDVQPRKATFAAGHQVRSPSA